ncbi:hypothetical protein BOTBODRAFT_69150 [Botryobasidium botryosum FD-172 SS1]|uniref:Uncharacterized protein n=1 Tax=Botryobasidium botryosum (strain FD-172 SS1) TaxID=930990 RepID=A0A067M1N4_BOTB1|nr:hypothetical protein BOTBODRAFT_69150 [Botryobasidium botryosum FD-172 SS1]
MYNCTTYWRKSIGPDEALAGLSHCQVSDEEGPDYVNYYEWRWRDQPEYTAEMDKDA